MPRYFHLLETRNRFANDAQRGRARGAAACMRRHGGGRETWVVDDDGGAGVDYTTIPAAVNAAAARDTIEVRSGTCARECGKNAHVDQGMRG